MCGEYLAVIIRLHSITTTNFRIDSGCTPVSSLSHQLFLSFTLFSTKSFVTFVVLNAFPVQQDCQLSAISTRFGDDFSFIDNRFVRTLPKHTDYGRRSMDLYFRSCLEMSLLLSSILQKLLMKRFFLKEMQCQVDPCSILSIKYALPRLH
jgi:hypothetical protein